MEERMKNPWLGLQAYREGEILYGRDEDIQRLSQQVLTETDTVLYGKSGIGKSSLLNAGVIPTARRRGVWPVAIRLEHRAGTRGYVEQVRRALEEAGVEIRREHAPVDEQHELFWEFVHCNKFYRAGERLKLLIVFDQFEEMFTLQQDMHAKRRFFEEMADLLNDVMPRAVAASASPAPPEEQRTDVTEAEDFDIEGIDFSLQAGTFKFVDDNEIHFVFTLREDFLSDFEYYTAAIPSLKQHRYGLRPINEEQAAEIIQKPCPGLVSREVAKLIIEKVTGRSDFEIDGKPEIEVDSAVLSLYLSRLFEEKEGDVITAALVENKGGEIIKDFYASCIKGVPPRVVEYLEDELLNDEGRRENKSLRIVSRAVGAQHVAHLVDCQLLRKFAYAGDIRVEFIHDILCPVVKERKEQRLLLRQQEEEHRKQEAEKKKILAAEEKKRKDIEEKAAAEKERMHAEALAARKRNRKRLLGACALLVALLVFCAYYYFANIHVYESYYARFERIDGWPVGVGEELSASERSRSPLYYKLSHKGRLPYHTDVEVLSSNARLPLSPRVEVLEVDGHDLSDWRAGEYYQMLSAIHKLHFVEGENGKIDKEIAIDERGATLFVINYFHLPDAHEAWLLFITPTGQSLKIRDNGVDRIKLSWNGAGRVESQMYFDAQGVGHAVAEGAYGYMMRYGADGQTTARYALDEYGRPLQADCNVRIARFACDTVETLYAKALSVRDSLPRPVVGPEGYSRLIQVGDVARLYGPEGQEWGTCRLRRDRRGNIVEAHTEGRLAATRPATVRYTYDEQTGYLIGEERLDANARPFVGDSSGIYKKVWQYTPEGQLALEEHFASDGKCLFSHRITRAAQVESDCVDDAIRGYYLLRVDSLKPDCRITSYYGRNRIPINHAQLQGKDTVKFHRLVASKSDKWETDEYYSYDSLAHRVVPSAAICYAYGSQLSVFRQERGTTDEGNRFYRLYDAAGRVLKSMIYYNQNGQTVARAVMGVDGTPVRCPDWEAEGYAYYKLYYNKDFEGNYVSVAAVNEWEQPSVFFDPFSSRYMTVSYKNYQGSILELGKLKTQIVKPFYQFTFESARGISSLSVPYLHVLSKSSPLYAEGGLRDGDRIVALGSWRLGQSETAFAAQWKLLADGPLPMVVLRPTASSFVRLAKSVRTGSQPLAECHFYALTEGERTFLQNYLNSYPQ